MEPDNINAPDHYTKGGIETIDYIKAKLTCEEYEGYLKGNVLKYLSREHNKGGLDDLKKARVYLDWLIESRETVKRPYKLVIDEIPTQDYFDDLFEKLVNGIMYGGGKANGISD